MQDDPAQQPTETLPAIPNQSQHHPADNGLPNETELAAPRWFTHPMRSRHASARPSSSRPTLRRGFLATSFFFLGIIVIISTVLNGQGVVCARRATTTQSAQSAQSTQAAIAVDTSTIASRISPLLFGQDLYYLDAGKTVFSDSAQTTYDSSLMKYVQSMRPTILRCGGGLDSEWYHWVYGIGPLATRVPTKMGKSPVVRVDNFGTDDCLRYAETIGASPIVQIDTNDYPVSSLNLWNPQATPAEAAALVAYINGSPKNPTVIGVDEHGVDWQTVGYWAQRRIDNGHAAPYRAAYFEIGNEDYSFSGQNGIQYGNRFLRFAQAMKAVDPAIKTGAVLVNDDPNNAWNTQVISVARQQIDFTIDHDYPMGDNSMERIFNPGAVTRTIAFPVAANTSYTISMKAIGFYAVPTGSHLIFTIDHNSYPLEVPRGHEAFATLSMTVPGSQLSRSGQHTVTMQFTDVPGYVDVYKDIRVNGTAYSFFSEQQIYENLLLTLERVNWYVDLTQWTMQNAGLPASVPLFITEYNLAFSATTPVPTYSASMMSALLLMKYIQHGVGMASMFLLSQPTPQHWNVIASDVSNPNNRRHWRNPQAYGFEIVRHHVGPYLLNDSIDNNPVSSVGIPSLNVVASKDVSANVLHLIVSNSSYDQPVSATLNLTNGRPGGAVTVTTLNAPSLLSTSNHPTASQIAITSRTLNGMSATSSYTFPAHSVTTFDIPLWPQRSPTPLPTGTAVPIAPTAPPAATDVPFC